jgi:hypothetical protein
MEKLVMNLPSKILVAALLAATPIGFAGSAGAAPRLGGGSGGGWGGGLGGGHGWGGGHFEGGHAWGGGHFEGGHRGWGWGGAAAGLAAGAIIGGGLAASQPWYGYDYDYSPGYYGYGYDPGYTAYSYAPGYETVAPGGDAAYCAQRFRSYDPASGTYLGYDGFRHPCP